MKELNAEMAVYAEIMKAAENYRDKIITAERSGKWRNTQGLHNAVYSAAGKLLDYESHLLFCIRRNYPNYLQNDDKNREWLETSYKREEIITGATRLTLSRARNYIIDITDACSDIMGTAIEFYKQGGIHENAGRELCNVVNILTGVKLSGFKDADTLDPLIRTMLRKARTPAKDLVLFGYKPEVQPIGKDDAADAVQEEGITEQINDEIKTPKIKKEKGTHGGKRAGAGRHKNAIPTVRITFKVTVEQAEEIKRFVDELRRNE